MRFVLRAAGWLCLIGLLGLVFSSARNQQVTAGLPQAASWADAWQLFLSTGSQALARQEIPEGPQGGLHVTQAVEPPLAARPAVIAPAKPGQVRLSAAHTRQSGTVQSVPSPGAAGTRFEQRRTDRPGISAPAAPQAQRLEIPSLKVSVQVVQVPFDQVTWDFTAIQQEVAQLGSLPGGTSTRNLVLAGHVTVHNGGHGPFRYLHWLKPGDLLVAETENTVQTYRVREQIVVRPEDVSVTENTSQQQLTLITCTDWSEELKLYQRRRVVLADLVSVEPKQERRQ